MGNNNRYVITRSEVSLSCTIIITLITRDDAVRRCVKVSGSGYTTRNKTN